MVIGGILLGAGALAALGCWATVRLLGRLDLDPVERLALALALFPAGLGLAAFVGFLVGWPGIGLPLCATLVLIALAWRVGARPHRQAGRGTGEGFALVAAALVLFGLGALGTTLLVPVWGGADRYGDWQRHWFLSLVYQGQPLPDLRDFARRVGPLSLTARTPLYNLEAGLLVTVLDAQFWSFQILGTIVGVPLAATAVLWARNVGGLPAARIAVPLVALSPFLLQNVAYPWPKVVAATFVLLFLHFVRVAALRRDSRRRGQALILAAVCAALGHLAHPTTILYVAPTIGWVAWRRPRPLLRTSLAAWGRAALAGLLILAPWHLWAVATLGPGEIVASSPIWSGEHASGDLRRWLVKTVVAGVATLIPIPAIEALARGRLPDVNALLRIQIGMLTGALGLAGCVLLVRSALRVRSGRGLRARGERLLRRPPWLLLVALVAFVGQMMLQPDWHTGGDAAESLTPIVVLGLAYIAREIAGLGPVGRRAVMVAVLAEFAAFHALFLWWAFGDAWTRDRNGNLAARYGLEHVRALWPAAVPLGLLALLSAAAAAGAHLWRGERPARRAARPAGERPEPHVPRLARSRASE